MDIKNIIKELEEERNKLDLKIIKINSIIEDLKELESPSQIFYTDREEDKPKIRKLLGQKRKYTKKSIKKVSGKKRKYTRSGKYSKKERPKDHSNQRRKSINYTHELSQTLKGNMGMKNQELVDLVKRKLGVDMRIKQVSDFFYTHNLSARRKKEKDKKKEPILLNNPLPKQSFRKKKLFPEEIDEFIKRKWESNKDSELRQLIANKFKVYYSVDQLKARRRMLDCVADRPGRKKKVEKREVKNHVRAGPVIKFNDDIIQFMREMWKSCSDEELSERIWTKFGVELKATTLKKKRAELGLLKKNVFQEQQDISEKEPEDDTGVDDIEEIMEED